MGRDYPNDSIAKNGQNPEMSPGDLRRLAVTQTPVKNHQLTLMWKTLKEKIIKIKRICKIVNFAVRADQRIKLKECEKKNKYLNLARELKKLWTLEETDLWRFIALNVQRNVTNLFLKP